MCLLACLSVLMSMFLSSCLRVFVPRIIHSSFILLPCLPTSCKGSKYLIPYSPTPSLISPLYLSASWAFSFLPVSGGFLSFLFPFPQASNRVSHLLYTDLRGPPEPYTMKPDPNPREWVGSLSRYTYTHTYIPYPKGAPAVVTEISTGFFFFMTFWFLIDSGRLFPLLFSDH